MITRIRTCLENYAFCNAKWECFCLCLIERNHWAYAKENEHLRILSQINQLSLFWTFPLVSWREERKKNKNITSSVIFQMQNATETLSSLNTVSKPGLHGTNRRWCPTKTSGWQRALAGVMLYTGSEDIIHVPKKNRMQTSHWICFFHSLSFYTASGIQTVQIKVFYPSSGPSRLLLWSARLTWPSRSWFGSPHLSFFPTPATQSIFPSLGDHLRLNRLIRSD